MAGSKTEWSPPDGYTLTRHEGYFMNAKGFHAGDSKPDAAFPDSTDEAPFYVHEWDESEPFVRDATGYRPNVRSAPIRDGWVPPRFTMTHESDETVGTVAPARVDGGVRNG